MRAVAGWGEAGRAVADWGVAVRAVKDWGAAERAVAQPRREVRGLPGAAGRAAVGPAQPRGEPEARRLRRAAGCPPTLAAMAGQAALALAAGVPLRQEPPAGA